MRSVQNVIKKKGIFYQKDSEGKIVKYSLLYISTGEIEPYDKKNGLSPVLFFVFFFRFRWFFLFEQMMLNKAWSCMLLYIIVRTE